MTALREKIQKSNKIFDVDNKAFGLLVESVKSFALFVLDLQGKISSWNPGAERIFGYKPKESIGKHFQKLFPNGVLVQDTFLNITHQVSQEQIFAARKDGSLFVANVTVTKLLGSSENLGYGCVVEDLSERNAAELRFLHTIQASPTGMILLNSKTEITFLNKRILETFGYSSQELNGQFLDILIPKKLGEQSFDLSRYFLEPSNQNLFKNPMDIFGLKKDGSKVRIEIRVQPLSFGEEVFLIASISDMTSRYETEQLIKRKSDEIEQFAYRTSHDLRSPLLSIQELSRFVEEDIAKNAIEEGLSNIRRIKRLTAQLLGLIEEILNITRSDYVDEPDEEIDFNLLTESLFEQLEIQFQKNKIEWRVDLKNTKPLHSQKARIRQIAENLVSNSLKYFDPQKQNPFVAFKTENSDTRFFISVSDNGIGIPESSQPEVFGMFKKFHKVDLPSSGLGLYLVKKEVDRLRGTISFTSSPQGSTFNVDLPLR